jgi:hypothetical protein
MNYFGVEINEAMVARKLIELRAENDEMLEYCGEIAIRGIVEDLWWENASESDRLSRHSFIEARFAGGEWSAKAAFEANRKMEDDLYRTFSDVWGNPEYFWRGEYERAY